MGWTVDTHDWRSDSAEEMFRLTAPGLLDRAIVLAHDGIGPGALRGGARQTVEYVRLVAVHAGQQGFTACRVVSVPAPLTLDLSDALAEIAAGAPARDMAATPSFPRMRSPCWSAGGRWPGMPGRETSGRQPRRTRPGETGRVADGLSVGSSMATLTRSSASPSRHPPRCASRAGRGARPPPESRRVGGDPGPGEGPRQRCRRRRR